MKLFQYAIIYNPLQTKDQLERGEIPKSVLVKDITSILVSDDKAAMLLAARSVPEEYVDKLDQIVIALKPF